MNKHLSITIRKQGSCICDECDKKWNYDYKEIADPQTLDIGYTNGFTHYLKCSEHKE